jgi:phosphate transport system ATP-binding protein
MNNNGNSRQPSTNGRCAIEARDLSVYHGDFRAVKDVNLSIELRKITAIIGPSGCGKSTMLRAFNRMNELVPTAHAEGQVLFRGQNIYASDVDPVQVRRHVGMVFQKPNPFPKSIYENVAWGARINGYRNNLDELVERSLRQAALWDEVKDKLDQSGYSLSGGKQQRLCNRSNHRGASPDHPDGRASFGPGPDRHTQDRRADAGTGQELYHYRRDP